MEGRTGGQIGEEPFLLGAAEADGKRLLVPCSGGKKTKSKTAWMAGWLAGWQVPIPVMCHLNGHAVPSRQPLRPRERDGPVSHSGNHGKSGRVKCIFSTLHGFISRKIEYLSSALLNDSSFPGSPCVFIDK